MRKTIKIVKCIFAVILAFIICVISFPVILCVICLGLFDELLKDDDNLEEYEEDEDAEYEDEEDY